MSDRPISTAAAMVAALKAHVAAKGLTHTEIEQRAGLAAGHWSKIASGRRLPSLDTVEKVCLGTDFAFLPVAVEKTAQSCSDGKQQLSDAPVNNGAFKCRNRF